MTNLERIRKMSSEEMAKAIDSVFLYDKDSCDFCAEDLKTCYAECEKGIKKWLESEVKG